MLGGVVVDGVFVAPEDADGVAADAQTRAGDEALVDGVVLAFVFLGEKPTIGNVLGAVLITAGVLVAALVR